MNYLCNNWQGFLEMCVYLIGRGYKSYCHITYPQKKIDKWLEIDKKLIHKYDAEKSKFQRSRQKKKGIANFYFLRWYDQVVIFRTQGIVSDAIQYDDQFHNITEKALELRISEDIQIRVPFTKPVTARLTKDSYRGFKAVLWDACTLKNKSAIIAEFDKVNGLPAWRGIIEQKRKLASFTVKQARRHNVKLKKSDLRILTKRKKYSPYSVKK